MIQLIFVRSTIFICIRRNNDIRHIRKINTSSITLKINCINIFKITHVTPTITFWF